MARYDANVRLNITAEYVGSDVDERPSDVKADLERPRRFD